MSGYGTLPHPVVIDGSQQEDERVRQPQVHFVGYTNPGDLSNPTDFSASRISSSLMCPSHPTASVTERRGKSARWVSNWAELSPGSLVKSFKKYCRNSLQMVSFVVRRCPSDVTLAICRSAACLSSSACNSWAIFVASQSLVFLNLQEGQLGLSYVNLPTISRQNRPI